MAAAVPDRLPGDRLHHKPTGRTGTSVTTDARGRTVWIPDDTTVPTADAFDDLEPAR